MPTGKVDVSDAVVIGGGHTVETGRLVSVKFVETACGYNHLRQSSPGKPKRVRPSGRCNQLLQQTVKNQVMVVIVRVGGGVAGIAQLHLRNVNDGLRPQEKARHRQAKAQSTPHCRNVKSICLDTQQNVSVALSVGDGISDSRLWGTNKLECHQPRPQLTCQIRQVPPSLILPSGQ